VTSSEWTKYDASARAVRARGRIRERRKKERGLDFSHVATHTWNAVCKCVQSDGSILQPVVPALIPLFPPCRSVSFSRASRVLRYPAGFLSGAHLSQIHIYSILRRRIRWPHRNPIDRLPSNDEQRPVGRSVGPKVLFRGAAKRGKSRLRRMNKILFSSRAAKFASHLPTPSCQTFRSPLDVAEAFKKMESSM